jgi:hypothetical protein
MNKLKLKEICSFKNGEIDSINLSKVYVCSQTDVYTSLIRASKIQPSALLTLAERPQNPDRDWMQMIKSMLPEGEVPTVRNILKLAARPANNQSLTLTIRGQAKTPDAADLCAVELPEKTVAIGAIRSTFPSRANIQNMELDIPFGMPRYVNVPTLRKMLGRSDSEKLLRNVGGDRWEICPESFMVDLTNPDVLFQLGPLNIYS